MRHLYQEAAKIDEVRRHERGRGAQDDHAQPGASSSASTSASARIEVGKDADLAIFNGHPLNSFARCEMTLVEGEVYFQRSDEAEGRRRSPRPPPDARRATARSSCRTRSGGRSCMRSATVHPVGGPPIADGTVVIDKGKI